jgi:hypothetical protein
MHGSTTEFLTEELKKLVGWGAHPKRVALMPTLRTLAQIEEGVSLVTAGYLVRKHLEDSIQALDGDFPFGGRQIEGQTLRRVLRLLLQFEGTGQSAENRRGRVIATLGIYYSVEQWRRPFGPERDLLRILATAMT